MILPTLCIFAVVLNPIHSANILFFTIVPSLSHQLFLRSIFRELSLRGHNVTAVTTDPLRDKTLVNLTEIDVGFLHDKFKLLSEEFPVEQSLFYTVHRILFYTRIATQSIYEKEHVLNVLKYQQFDLVIVENVSPLAFAIVANTKTPLIGATSFSGMITNHESVGNPTHPIVTPYMLLPSSTKMTFYERLLSVMFNIFVKFHYKYFEIPKCEKIAKQYFGNIPSLWEIERNISLIITNANPIINPVRPNVPAVVQVYGIPMGVAKRLPKDLQYFLDNSTNGVIYCSLGTSIPCSNTSTTEFKKLRQVFDELPYNVLWKCDVSETDESNKILFKKWMPQQSVLKHPNIKVFVTQGGVHSIEESLENGIPMLGLPFFVDQPQNVKKLILEGIGLGANLKTDSVDQIKRQITELIENNKYKKAVLDKRNILMDQPMSGMDKVIWWIEYVLRHKGARHLRSAAADLPFYQYFLLDVIAFFLGAVVFISFITYVVVVYVKRYLQAIKIKKD